MQDRYAGKKISKMKKVRYAELTRLSILIINTVALYKYY